MNCFGQFFVSWFQKTGKEYAIKVFNNRNAGSRFAAARRREFEVLRKVNHENVIRMFRVEEEVSKLQECGRIVVLIAPEVLPSNNS